MGAQTLLSRGRGWEGMAAGEQAPLWKEILSGASSTLASTEPKTLIVLGDEGVGKGSLINSLRRSGSEQGTRTALEYTYIDPFGEEEGELAPRLNVWKLNGAEQHQLLQFALNPQMLLSTVVMVVVDFSKPWTFQASVEEWLRLLREQLLAAYDECPEAGLEQQHQAALSRFFQNYVEPPKDGSKVASFSSAQPDASGLAGGDDIMLPLGEGTLTKNLGIPIILVCNKTDTMSAMEK